MICSHVSMTFEVKLKCWFWSHWNRKWSGRASAYLMWKFYGLILKKCEKTLLEEKFAFSVVVFCSHAVFCHRCLLYFWFFICFFFLSEWFYQFIHNPFYVFSFLFSQWNFSELCQDLSCYVFSLSGFLLRPHDVTITLFILSSNFHSIARVT